MYYVSLYNCHNVPYCGGFLVAEEVFRHFAHICQYFWGELYGNRSNYLSHVFRTKLNYNVYKVSK